MAKIGDTGLFNHNNSNTLVFFLHWPYFGAYCPLSFKRKSLENQAGFRKNHSITDHIFVLHMIIKLP
jgi:hypothetical protein